MTLHVAIVGNFDGLSKTRSHRSQGDWAAFVAENEEEAVNRALEARDLWRSATREYRVYVGTVTGEVQTPRRYRVVSLELPDDEWPGPDDQLPESPLDLAKGPPF